MHFFSIFAPKDSFRDMILQKFAPVMDIQESILPALKEKFGELMDCLHIVHEEEIYKLREDRRCIVYQEGGQKDMLSSTADIMIGGGARGGGKTYMLLMQALYDIVNPNFRAIIFRKDLDDLSDIIDAMPEPSENREENDIICDLAGRRLQQAPRHGFYIRNGKTYMAP